MMSAMPSLPTVRLAEGLTEAQREAVLHTDGPLLVLAGPGSGKTRVITHRAARLAATVARPEEILAITFTNKAAGEMRARIAALGIGARMWVCTFHSLCARLLRTFGQAVGVRPTFSIFDEADAKSLIREAIAACRLSADNWTPAAVRAAISDAKNRMLSPTEYAAQAADFTEKTVARIYQEYQRLLVEQNGCDFDDLLMHVARLLGEHADIREELSDRFRYLLIDEYQDTNHAQYLIATRLAQAHRNICATGDPDQSIYAWRGADIQNILDFEADYPDARVVRLEENFRSTQAICSAAGAVIAHNRQRRHKDLWTRNPPGDPVQVWACDDQTHEARRVAEDIRRYLEEGGQAGDVVVFYRINALSRAVEDELRRLKIPYQVARGVEFYGRKEIKDVLAYLRAVVNPADETALVRAVNTPPRGIGKVTIERLRTSARAQGVDLGAALARAGETAELKSAAKKLRPVAELLEELRRMPPRPVRAIVEAVLSRSGLEAALRQEGEIDNEPLANVYELVNAARQYDEEHANGSLGEWLHQISLVSDVDSVELSGGFVTLMTLHAAKGLEFPVVYMIGLEDGLLPHRRAVLGDDGDLEEERRLCFVGMTRAQKRLTLTHARYRMVRGLTERTVASRFLRELPADEVRTVSRSASPRLRPASHFGQYQAEETAEDFEDDPEFRIGQRVCHPEYGKGRVMALDRRGRQIYVRVYFDDHGLRAFALEHAELSLLEYED